MSDVNKIPEDLTLEQVIDGIEKFVAELEAEVALHHDNPQWMDTDMRCTDEENLLNRVKIISGMLDEVTSHFDLPADHPVSVRITAVKSYFSALD